VVMKTLGNILGLALAGLTSVAWSQTANWNDPGPIIPGSTVRLQLVFTDCKPTGKISLPEVGAVRFLDLISQETQASLSNFQFSSSHVLTYLAQVNQRGRIPIPAFEVQTDKGRKAVPSLTLDATASAPSQQPAASAPFANLPGFFRNPPPATPSNPAGSIEIQSETSIQPASPFVGEVSEVQLAISIPRAAGIEASPISRPLWSPAGAEAEPWQEPSQVSPNRIELRTRIMYPKEGRAEIPAVKMTFRTFRLVPTIFMLQRQPAGDLDVSSSPRAIDVRPLPTGAPAGFKGAVGQFTLESKMVPEQVNEGEPITWTLSLKGTGNWPMGVELPARTVPSKMRTIQPKLRREFDGTQIFTGGLVEDLVLIPTEAGEYELPAVKFAYFDPKKKAYETVEAKPPKISVLKEGTLRPNGPAQVTIAPGGMPTQKQGAGPGWGGFGSGKQPKGLQYGEPALPREPLPGTGVGFAPVPAGWIHFLAVLPWLALVGVWWNWARKRAVLTDPERSRKEALQSWKSAVQILRAEAVNAEVREKSLLLWQKAVAATLGVDAATPSWTDISGAAPTLQEGDRADLEKCWEESEEALYGRNSVLHGDWCERAAVLASRIDLPPLRFWEPLRARNILPWLGLFVLLALPAILEAQEKAEPSPTPVAAEDPIRLYREGSFEKAGQIWGEAVRKRSSDPVSRNNLGLAWFQVGDKERALAQALSAYLVAPRTATVEWNTAIFANASDQLDPAIRRLLDDTWRAWLTSRAGVLAWQLGLVAGSTVAALGVGLWLAAGYYAWRRRLFFRLGSGVLLAGASMTFVAGSALGVYGKLSDRAAVMIVDVVPLRSVPTEVQQTEKAYPPGSIAHREKEFLGWSKVRMPNHDVGWIRTENLVPLY